MKLSTRTRYGTLALIDLAVHGRSNSPIPLKEIAERQGFSPDYLEHIALALTSAGIVKSVRGVKGGVTLARPAHDITLKEIYEILEGPIQLVDCSKGPTNCPRKGTCVTQDVWNQLEQAIDQILASTTLQELVDRERNKTSSSDMYYI